MSLIPVWLQSRYIDRVTEIPVVVDLPGQVPAYAREGDAGADLRTTQAITLDPGERALVGTGVCIGLPREPSDWSPPVRTGHEPWAGDRQ